MVNSHSSESELGGVQITSRTIPGLFDLVDSNVLNEDEIDIGKISLYETDAQPVLIGSQILTSLDMPGLRGWIKNVVSWLKGYRKKRIICNKEPTWVSLIELYAPPNGKAVFEHTATSENTKGPEFEIAGINFGASQVVTLSRSISFPTTSGRALQIEMLATITERENESTGDKMYVGSLDPRTDHIASRYLDLQPMNIKASGKTENGWTLLEIINARESLSRGSDDVFTHTYKTQKAANWKVGLSISIPELAKLGFSVEVKRASEFSVNYEMPFGQDYGLYGKIEEVPLAPLCVSKI